jgi:hypothetical protein
MRTALRSTGRHAHVKTVLSARRRTRRATAVAPLGVRPRPLRLGGLKTISRKSHGEIPCHRFDPLLTEPIR